MLHKFVAWMRTESGRESQPGRWARWLGRNWARLTYAVRVEPTWLELNHHQVPISDLHPHFSGLRIVQLSDFPCGHQGTAAYLAEAVTLAQAPNPDLVVLPGAFVPKGVPHVKAVGGGPGSLAPSPGTFRPLGHPR